MSSTNNFTVIDGIKVQSEQLKKWEQVLKPSVFKELKKWATKDNLDPRHKDGYTILRGQSMESFIQNYPNIPTWAEVKFY